ncbi:hypothetical protein AC1031_021021 [Aphanomyces cochlioides]|nr:hypothetical protein AC1031_021021 [Aphanomyces cochlioides]
MKQTVRLLDIEWVSILGVTISTVTFYEAINPTADLHQATKTYLDDRVHGIVQANPWLGGRHSCGWLGSNLALDYDRDAPQPIQVEEVELPQLSPDLSYDAFVSMCAPLEVQSGLSVLTVNTDLPLIRIHSIKISDTRGALFFSLSHGLGDGDTYYRLYGMLSAGKPMEALTVDRWKRWHGYVEKPFVSLQHVVVGQAAVTVMRTFNSAWVEQEKAKYKSMSPTGYVSTNDVITSWVFRKCNCKVGFMAINFQGRVQGVENHLAGSYELALGYQPEDYATPALIRESLAVNGLRRARSGAFQWMLTGATSVITTWATLYAPAHLPGRSMVEHMPVLELKPYFTSGAIIFQRTGDSIGMIYANRNPHSLDDDDALIPTK